MLAGENPEASGVGVGGRPASTRVFRSAADGGVGVTVGGAEGTGGCAVTVGAGTGVSVTMGVSVTVGRVGGSVGCAVNVGTGTGVSITTGVGVSAGAAGCVGVGAGAAQELIKDRIKINPTTVLKSVNNFIFISFSHLLYLFNAIILL